MKTKSIFNAKRFGKFIKSMTILSYKKMLLYWGTIATMIIIGSFMAMTHNTSTWNYGDWLSIFLFIFIVSGCLYAGFSFPYFRSNEKRVHALMIPVSSFERFIYEVFGKLILFIILFPIVFYLSSSFTVLIRNIFENGKIITVDGRTTFPFEFISLKGFPWNENLEQLKIIVSLGILAFTLAFAGGAVFKKLPLIKSVVFVGILIALGAGYFYLIFGKFRLNHPWFECLIGHSNDQQMFLFFEIIILISCLTTLAYAYFKVKEKEVQ